MIMSLSRQPGRHGWPSFLAVAPNNKLVYGCFSSKILHMPHTPDKCMLHEHQISHTVYILVQHAAPTFIFRVCCCCNMKNEECVSVLFLCHKVNMIAFVSYNSVMLYGQKYHGTRKTVYDSNR